MPVLCLSGCAYCISLIKKRKEKEDTPGISGSSALFLLSFILSHLIDSARAAAPGTTTNRSPLSTALNPTCRQWGWTATLGSGRRRQTPATRSGPNYQWIVYLHHRATILLEILLHMLPLQPSPPSTHRPHQCESLGPIPYKAVDRPLSPSNLSHRPSTRPGRRTETPPSTPAALPSSAVRRRTGIPSNRPSTSLPTRSHRPPSSPSSHAAGGTRSSCMPPGSRDPARPA